MSAPLTIEEATARLGGLSTGDPESDHLALDELLVDILKAITKARDPREMRALAKVGLQAERCVPTRWYA